MGQGVRVELLGSFRLQIDGHVRTVKRKQVREALTLLASNPGQPQARSVLIDHIWRTRLPKDPSASLRVLITRAREVLAPYGDILRLVGDGYVLDAASDIADFVSLIDSPSSDAAYELWRGTPFCEIEELGGLLPLRTRLESMYRTVALKRAETLLDVKRHQAALNVAAELSQSNPSDEAALALHAKALAALGRRSDAIDLLQRAAAELVNRGLTSSLELMSAERQVLTSAPDLAPQRISSSNQTRPVLAGRSEELESIVSQAGGTLLIVGESGSGKSSLLGEAAELVPNAIMVKCVEAPSRPIECLTNIVLQLHATTLTDTPEVRTILRRLAPDHLDQSEQGPSLSSRAGLLAAARAAISEALSRPGAALYIDDAQWADRTSIELIEQLAADGVGPIALGARTPIVPGLQAVVGSAETIIELGPLSATAISELVAERLASFPDTTSSEISELSGGNPLLTTLAIEMLGEGVPINELPGSVLLIVRERLESLPRGSEPVLETLSLFENGTTRDVLDVLHPEANSAIAAAKLAGLVSVDQSGWVAFRHALIRLGITQLIPEGLRIDRHDLIAQVLEQLETPPIQIVRHAARAAAIDPERAALTHLSASVDFADGYDWPMARHHATEGLAIWRTAGVADETMLGGLSLQLGVSKVAAGESGDQPLFDALQIGMIKNDTSLLSESLIALATQPRLRSSAGEQILSALEQGLDQLPDSTLRTRLLAAGSTLCAMSPLQDRGRKMFRQAAMTLFERGEDMKQARRDVLTRIHLGCPAPEDYELRHRCTEVLHDLAPGDPDLEWEVAFLRFGHGMVMGLADQVLANLGRLRALAPRLRVRSREFGMGFCEVAWLVFTNDLDKADNELARLFGDAHDELDADWAITTYSGMIVAIRERQARLGELLPMTDQHLEDDPDSVRWHLVSAAAAAQADDLSRAAAEIDWLLEDDLSGIVRDLTFGGALSMFGHAVLATQHGPGARALLPLLKPLAGTNLWNGACVHRPADEVIRQCEAIAAF